MLKPLPHWCMTGEHPAFYDTESRTAIQMVARLYSKMEELIEDYNTYVDQIDNLNEEFKNDVNAEITDFETEVNGIVNEFVETVNGKIAEQNLEIESFEGNVNTQLSEFETEVNGKISAQDLIIADAVNYMKTNLNQIVTDLFTETIQDRDILITLGINYDETNEELTIGLIPVVEDEEF